MTNPIQANIYVMLGFTQRSFNTTNTTDGVNFSKRREKGEERKREKKKSKSK
jgi:hypothetical protein